MKKQPIGDNDARKYKINECLLRQPVDQHRFAVKIIPRLFGISLNTFHNYRNILRSDTQDIPHEIVVGFEQFFAIPSGTLLNKKVRIPSLSELLEKERHLKGINKQQDEVK